MLLQSGLHATKELLIVEGHDARQAGREATTLAFQRFADMVCRLLQVTVRHRRHHLTPVAIDRTQHEHVEVLAILACSHVTA